MTYTVLGLFSDRDNTEEAVHDLQTAGYNPKNISIVMKDNHETQIPAVDSGIDIVGGAVSGATAGIIAGGLAGLLIGVGAIAIPGIGGLLIAGPLATALGLTGVVATTVSSAATGGLAGGLIGALIGLGLPKEDASYYEKGIRNGATLLAVPAFADREDEAKEILQRNGADQIRAIATPGGDVISEENDSYIYPSGSLIIEQPTYAYAWAGRKGGKTKHKQRTKKTARRIIRSHTKK